MRKVLGSLGIIAMMLCGVVGLVMSEDVYAADDVCSDTSIDEELRRAAGCKIDGVGVFTDENQTVVPVVLKIIEVILTFTGVIATIVVIYGGFVFVTSTADASKITKAKKSIMYGLIGMVIALMAYAIVKFINMSVLQK